MTFETLKADIADWLNRSDLTDQIPKFITLAEAEFNRELRVPDMEFSDSAIMSSGSLDLPLDFLGFKAIYLNADYAGDLIKVPLSQKSAQQLTADYPDDTVTAVPTYYALSGSRVIFGPYPDDDYELAYSYYALIPTLSALQTTNWLLDAHPDLYMAAAQWHASVYLKDWEAVTYFRGETGRLMDAIRRSGIKKAMGAASIAIPSPIRQNYTPGVRV